MDEEQEVIRDVSKYRLLHSELPKNLIEKIVRMSEETITANPLDKDACNALVAKLNACREFEDLGQLKRSR